MNNEKMTQEQRAQLIEKLHNEYNDLNGKIARLNAFLCDIDFIKKVPDIIEQELMKGQLRAMENYMSNLRGRIMFQEAHQKTHQQIDDWTNMKGKVSNIARKPNTDEQPIEIKTQREPTFDSNPKCYFCGGVIEGLPFIKDGKPACEACATEHHHCGQDVRVQYDPNESQPVNIPVQGDDCDDACCQARKKGPVGDGSAVVEKSIITGESLQQLIGYQVIAVCKPGSKCNGCPYEHYNAPCVKVEIVGGFFLCMEPLTNSIVTE